MVQEFRVQPVCLYLDKASAAHSAAPEALGHVHAGGVRGKAAADAAAVPAGAVPDEAVDPAAAEAAADLLEAWTPARRTAHMGCLSQQLMTCRAGKTCKTPNLPASMHMLSEHVICGTTGLSYSHDCSMRS